MMQLRAGLVLLATLLAPAAPAAAQPLPIIDVPFVSQTEALCGGAAAAMVLRFWGAGSLTAESFAPLVDGSAAGIPTDALAADIERRGFGLVSGAADAGRLQEWLSRGWPVIALIEERLGTYHYVVVVAWHNRGVIVHDPARAPFQVMSVADFERRWARADRWSLLVLGSAPRDDGSPRRQARASPAPAASPAPIAADDRCAVLVTEAVARANANDLATAERQLTQALGCPGGAAARELAGIRLLQERWTEVVTLASAAVAADATDAYAWKLLGTARFVDNDPLAALDAWNRAGEPRVDLIRVDGLVRTRQQVVERLVNIDIGERLTAPQLRRAQRQLAELPSAAATSVRYVPVGGGLVRLSTAIAERPAWPRGAAALAAAGVIAATRRELEIGFASLTGSGERITFGWRFWPHRPRYSLGVRAPAPWGGIWSVDAAYEHQPFSDGSTPARRETAEVWWGSWLRDGVRLQLAGGLDRWRHRGLFGSVGGGAILLAQHDRLRLDAEARTWFGDRWFGSWQIAASSRTSSERRGLVGEARATIGGVSLDTPPDVWAAGDTGHVRSVPLRAHPLLDDEGRIRTDRLGRIVAAASLEGQLWRHLGPVAIAPAVFVDAARTAVRAAGPPLADVDAGAGVRLAPPGFGGMIRVDVAKGLRDGEFALSVVYER
jgi:hypothetical protein